MRLPCLIGFCGLISAACNPPDNPDGSGGFSPIGSGSNGSPTSGTSSTSTGGFVAAQHRDWPVLPKTGTGLIESARIVLVLPQNLTSDEVSAYQALSLQLPTSHWFSAWAPGYTISAMRPSTSLAGAPIPSGSVFDASSGAEYIDAAIASAGSTFVADSGSVYLVMLPVGSSIANTGSGVNGHHWRYGTDGAGLAMVAADQAGTSALTVRTAVASHEVAEAITDTGSGYQLSVNNEQMPWAHSVWTAWEGETSLGGSIENGDFCEGDRYAESSVTYQRIYDNAAAASHGDPCVPALLVPYFNVSTDKDWYSGAKGTTLQIPFNGWSTAPTDDMYLTAEEAAGNTNDNYALALVGRTKTVNGHIRQVINNGESAKLSVTIPANAQSGDWEVISIWSWHEDLAGNTPAGEDLSHLFAVGVYVP